MKTFQAVACALADGGVERLFGLMGDANMAYVVSYIQHGQGTYVAALDERSATAMADGYARRSGKVGVVSVTHGPGAANTINPLVEAVRAGTPLLLLTGDTPAKYGEAQDIELSALFAATGADYYRAKSPAMVAGDVLRALGQVAATGRPMVLNIPVDMLAADVEYESSARQSVVTPVLSPDPQAVDAAVGALVASSRPVILAGAGAVKSDAADALVALGELVGAPLATSVGGKSLFFGQPYDLGIMGTIVEPWAAQVIAQANCIVSFGASLNTNTTVDGGFLRGKTVIQVDSDPAHIARWHEAGIGVVGDARATAEAMVAMLTEAEYVAESPYREHALAPASIRERNLAQLTAEPDDPLDPKTASILLDQLLPTARVLTLDSGRFMLPVAKYLHAESGADFFHPMAWTSIGLGIATAIGISIADPGRVTVALVGDGGGYMGLLELPTAVRLKLPLVVVVYNDAAYGAEYMKLPAYGMNPDFARIELPDLTAIAQSLGARAVKVSTRSELEMALRNVADLDGPLLIDLHLSATQNWGVPGQGG
ncbi:thiamine pyrophosphate-binding protein [Microbacterium sp.]|uniref:thiamine pyrophosphate-binding protein n=1 Tax=Microbacterium sp. TaxID=51671 RepID=UPI0039E6F7A9